MFCRPTWPGRLLIPSFKVVSVDVPAGNQTWEASVLSKSGKCFWIKDVSSGAGAGTFYGSGAAAACKGTEQRAPWPAGRRNHGKAVSATAAGPMRTCRFVALRKLCARCHVCVHGLKGFVPATDISGGGHKPLDKTQRRDKPVLSLRSFVSRKRDSERVSPSSS